MNATLRGSRSDRVSDGNLTRTVDPGVDTRRTTAGGLLAAAVPVALVVAVLLPAVAVASVVSLTVAAVFSLVVGRRSVGQ